MSDQIFYTEGAGNSFFLSFVEEASFAALKKSAKSKGLDPDGYILSQIETENRLGFQFYNKDGSLVDFCGNALRVVALCFFKLTKEKRCTLKTAVGDLELEVISNEKVRSVMPKAKVESSVVFQGISGVFVLAGVPHLVFESVKVKEQFKSLKAFCKTLRQEFLPKEQASYNLTFWKKAENHKVNVLTFERGVEDFTLACGSGALSVFEFLQLPALKVEMPGGALELQRKFDRVELTGPAKIIEVF